MLRPRVAFQADEDRKIITVRYIGAINGDQIIADMLPAFRALGAPWEYDCIYDLTRHTGVVATTDNEALGRGWQDICGGRDAGRRTAIVSTDPLIDARLTLSQRLFPFRTLALFGTAEAAREWIETSRAESGTGASAA